MTAMPIHELAAFLGQHRFRLNSERVLQDEIEEALTTAGIAHQREHRLGAAGIVDFMVERIGIEAKVGGSKRDIHRQCVRYCDHPDVDGLIVATGVALALPGLSKPTLIVNLGRAWL